MHCYEEKIKQIRRDVLEASYKAGACHLGSALSCIGILVPLVYSIKPSDVFIFAKASGVATYYAIMSDLGFFSKDDLVQYIKNYPLPSKEVPGVIHSLGSVGHGLPVAAGLALADRTRRVFVLLSDGDCQEGATLEAVSFARHHKLDNLYVIVDDNGLQACGATKDIMDMTEIFDFMKRSLPKVEIVKTTKGEGVSFMENKYEWHYKNLTQELLEQALKENA